MTTRIETDTLGSVEVPADRYWGAHTERARHNFAIGGERWGRPLVRALGLVKRAAARANREVGALPADVADLIERAAGEVVDGDLDDHFPLSIWQSGSGTQTNMNANEVIANRAIELAGGTLGSKQPVHPNDHVNRGQSSNDVIPTAIHVAALERIAHHLVPAVRGLRATLDGHAAAFADLVKLGRTHVQDAVPLTVGQEMSGWVAQLDHALGAVDRAAGPVHELPLGGTAVGTGLGAHPDFARAAVARLATATGLPLVRSSNRFAASSAHDPLVALHGALRVLAVALTKLASDVRWLASGPRAGLGELTLPANEPGSSIMPGKVNPTQCEALIMVCAQVIGHDAAVTVAGLGGLGANLQLHTAKPLLAHALVTSIGLLGDAVISFDRRCAAGLAPVPARIAAHVDASLMLVTALAPHLGHDTAAAVARRAVADGTTLRAAALALGAATAEQLDAWLDPTAMTGRG